MYTLTLDWKSDETRNYLLDETKHIDLMGEKHKKVCRTLNHFEHFLVFVSAVSSCIWISVVASLVGVHMSIASSVVGINIVAITAEIKKCIDNYQEREGKTW